MKIFAMLMAMLLIYPAAAQRKSKTETPALPIILEGISYSLPQTGIRVIVEARQKTFVPGPYAMYSEQLLGIRDVKTQPYTLWEMEEVRFETFAEPDPGNTYKATGGAAAFLQLTPAGILAGINSNAEIKACLPDHSGSFALTNQAPGLVFHNLFDNPTLTGRSSADQRAIHAASRILKARNTRFEIAAGLLDEFHPDGEAYEESIEELQRIEEELLALFVGKSVTKNYSFAFDYVPQAPATGEVIFRFDETRGFLPKSDLSGKPVMIDVERDENLAAKLQAVQGDPMISTDFSGIFYRQPGLAEIRIMRELTLIASGKAAIAQFGGIAALPRELLDGSYSIEFHPETGAIKNIRKK